MSDLFNGQAVKVTTGHNHIKACNQTIYTIGAINRVRGAYMVNLLSHGKSVGAVPERNLKAQ